jgi:hypothetical protein
VDGTGSGLCPMAGFVISSVETSCSAVTVLVTLLIHYSVSVLMS